MELCNIYFSDLILQTLTTNNLLLTNRVANSTKFLDVLFHIWIQGSYFTSSFCWLLENFIRGKGRINPDLPTKIKNDYLGSIHGSNMIYLIPCKDHIWFPTFRTKIIYDCPGFIKKSCVISTVSNKDHMWSPRFHTRTICDLLGFIQGSNMIS